MSAGIILPIGATVTLTMQGGRSYVIAAPAGIKAELDLMRQPGGMSAVFTHDPGLSWTDAAGERTATGFLAHGVPCIFKFTSLGAALKFKARLEKEGVQ